MQSIKVSPATYYLEENACYPGASPVNDGREQRNKDTEVLPGKSFIRHVLASKNNGYPDETKLLFPVRRAHSALGDYRRDGGYLEDEPLRYRHSPREYETLRNRKHHDDQQSFMAPKYDSLNGTHLVATPLANYNYYTSTSSLDEMGMKGPQEVLSYQPMCEGTQNIALTIAKRPIRMYRSQYDMVVDDSDYVRPYDTITGNPQSGEVTYTVDGYDDYFMGDINVLKAENENLVFYTNSHSAQEPLLETCIPIRSYNNDKRTQYEPLSRYYYLYPRPFAVCKQRYHEVRNFTKHLGGQLDKPFQRPLENNEFTRYADTTTNNLFNIDKSLPRYRSHMHVLDVPFGKTVSSRHLTVSSSKITYTSPLKKFATDDLPNFEESFYDHINVVPEVRISDPIGSEPSHKNEDKEATIADQIPGEASECPNLNASGTSVKDKIRMYETQKEDVLHEDKPQSNPFLMGDVMIEVQGDMNESQIPQNDKSSEIFKKVDCKSLKFRLEVVQRENMELKIELCQLGKRYDASIDSIRRFWAPEFKKIKKTEQIINRKLCSMTERYRVIRNENQTLTNIMESLKQRHINKSNQFPNLSAFEGEYSSNHGERYKSDDMNMNAVQQLSVDADKLKRLIHGKEDLEKKNEHLQERQEEIENQIKLQNVTLKSRDETIKHLLELLSKYASIRATRFEGELLEYIPSNYDYGDGKPHYEMNHKIDYYEPRDWRSDETRIPSRPMSEENMRLQTFNHNPGISGMRNAQRNMTSFNPDDILREYFMKEGMSWQLMKSKLLAADSRIDLLEKQLARKNLEIRTLKNEKPNQDLWIENASKVAVLQSIIDAKDARIVTLEAEIKIIDNEFEAPCNLTRPKVHGKFGREKDSEPTKIVGPQHKLISASKKIPAENEVSDIPSDSSGSIHKSNQVDLLKTELHKSVSELNSYQARYETLEKQLEDYKKHVTFLKENVNAKEAQVSILQTDIDSLRDRLDEVNQSYEKMKSEKKVILRSRDSISLQLDQTTQHLDIKEQTIQIYQTKVRSLEDLLKEKDSQLGAMVNKFRGSGGLTSHASDKSFVSGSDSGFVADISATADAVNNPTKFDGARESGNMISTQDTKLENVGSSKSLRSSDTSTTTYPYQWHNNKGSSNVSDSSNQYRDTSSPTSSLSSWTDLTGIDVTKNAVKPGQKIDATKLNIPLSKTLTLQAANSDPISADTVTKGHDPVISTSVDDDEDEKVKEICYSPTTETLLKNQRLTKKSPSIKQIAQLAQELEDAHNEELKVKMYVDETDSDEPDHKAKMSEKDMYDKTQLNEELEKNLIATSNALEDSKKCVEELRGREIPKLMAEIDKKNAEIQELNEKIESSCASLKSHTELEEKYEKLKLKSGEIKTKLLEKEEQMVCAEERLKVLEEERMNLKTVHGNFTIETSNLKHHISELQDKVRNLESQIDKYVDEGLQLRREIQKMNQQSSVMESDYRKCISNLENDSRQKNQDLIQKEKEIDRLTKVLKLMEQDKLSVESELGVIKAKTSFSVDAFKNFPGQMKTENESADQEDIMNEQLEKITELEERIQDLEVELEDKERIIMELKERLDESEEGNLNEFSMVQDQKNYELTIQKIEAENKRLKDSVNDLQEHIQKNVDRIEELEEELKRALEVTSETRHAMEGRINLMNEKDKELDEIRAKNSELENIFEQQSSKINEILVKYKSKDTTLKSLIAERNQINRDLIDCRREMYKSAISEKDAMIALLGTTMGPRTEEQVDAMRKEKEALVQKLLMIE